MQDVLQQLVTNILTLLITLIITGAVSLAVWIYKEYAKVQLEAIQATLKPSIDVEIESSIRRYDGSRVLLLDITIKNVGDVISALVDFWVSLWRHDFEKYPKSSILFNNKKVLTISFRKKICYKDIPNIKYPKKLRDTAIICGMDPLRRNLVRFDGSWDNCCGNYITDDIVEYDYHVNEFRHFTFPIIISGHGTCMIRVFGGFMRHKWVKGERILDVTDEDMIEIDNKFRIVNPYIDDEELMIGGNARYYFSEDMLCIIPEDKQANPDYDFAVSLFSEGEYEKALKLFEKVVKSEKTYYRKEIADYYYQYGHIVFWGEESLPLYDRAIELDPTHLPALLDRGDILRTLNRSKEALQDFDEAVKLAPEDSGVYYRRARNYEELEQYDDALSDYSRAIELNPLTPVYHHDWGNLLKKLDRADEALLAFEKAITLDPDHTSSFTSYVKLLEELSRYNEVLEAYDTAIKRNPTHSSLWIDRARFFKRLKQYKKALSDYNKALVIDASLLYIELERASLLVDMGRQKRALDEYNRIIDAFPDDPLAFNDRGLLRRTMGHNKEALEDFNQAIEIGFFESEFRFNRGITLVEMGLIEDAQADLKELLKEKSHFADELKSKIEVALKKVPSKGS